jgi:hypothetical protein
MIVRYIYAYREKATGRAVYVGSAFDSAKRDRTHSNGDAIPFDREIKRRGRDAFTLEIVDFVFGTDMVDAMAKAVLAENWWMDELFTFRTPQGFNFGRASFTFDSVAAYKASNAAKRAGWTKSVRTHQSNATKEQWANTARRERLIAAKAAGWTPEKRAAQAERLRLAHKRLEVKATHAAANKQRGLSIKKALSTTFFKNSQSARQKSLWKSERAVRIAAMRRGWTPEARAHQSVSIKAMWARRKEAQSCCI